MPDAFSPAEEELDRFKVIVLEHEQNMAALTKKIDRHNFQSLVTTTLCMCSLLAGGVLALQEADRVMKREALVNQENLAWKR